MGAGELVGAPWFGGEEVGGVGAGVGPCVVAVVQGDAGQGVDVGFEGVEGFSFCLGEVVEQVSGGGGGRVGDEAGVDPFRQSDDAPSGDRDRDAVGVAVDKNVEDVREEEASVDEQGRRVRRCGGQPARAG